MTLWYDKSVKTTRYFDYMRQRSDRAWIKMSWIEMTISKPDAEELQLDGRHRFWKRIDEADGRFLRVVTLADMKTVHNAFFDRRFKG